MQSDRYGVVVGSLNIDLVVMGERKPKKGETTVGSGFGLFPGGKGANQAVQLARLGMETYMLGRVGEDVFAGQVVESLESAGVRTELLIRDPHQGTGKGCVFIDAAGDNWIVVVPEANMSWERAELEAATPVIQSAAMLVVQLEIPLEIAVQAIEIAHAAKVPVMLNPAPAQPLPEEIYGMVDYLVPNETEAAILTSRPVKDVESAIEAGKNLKARGVKCVIITLGEAGSVSVTDAGVVHTPPYAIRAVDVTAAGDSFCSSLAYGLMSGQEFEKALKFASASGALTAAGKGAQPSLPTLEEIHSFMARKDSRDE